MNPAKMTYLGDAVMVRFDGYHLVLTLDDGRGDHGIAIEPAVWNNLCRYAKEIPYFKQAMEEHSQ